jgi:hypothetical protein
MKKYFGIFWWRRFCLTFDLGHQSRSFKEHFLHALGCCLGMTALRAPQCLSDFTHSCLLQDRTAYHNSFHFKMSHFGIPQTDIRVICACRWLTFAIRCLGRTGSHVDHSRRWLTFAIRCLGRTGSHVGHSRYLFRNRLCRPTSLAKHTTCMCELFGRAHMDAKCCSVFLCIEWARRPLRVGVVEPFKGYIYLT